MPPAQLTPADLQTLARLAGLDITPEREPAVLTELNTQISNLLLIETILPAPNPAPTLVNSCYSMVSYKLAIHVTSVHKYDVTDRTFKAVPGGGVSSAMNEAEANYTMNWARNIWADSLL